MDWLNTRIGNIINMTRFALESGGTEKWTYRQAGRQARRQAGKQACRQAGRQTSRRARCMLASK